MFRKIYVASVPGGRVVVRDHILSPDRIRPRSGALFAVNMLVGTRRGILTRRPRFAMPSWRRASRCAGPSTRIRRMDGLVEAFRPRLSPSQFPVLLCCPGVSRSGCAEKSLQESSGDLQQLFATEWRTLNPFALSQDLQADRCRPAQPAIGPAGKAVHGVGLPGSRFLKPPGQGIRGDRHRSGMHNPFAAGGMPPGGLRQEAGQTNPGSEIGSDQEAVFCPASPSPASTAACL